jgi:hypothetical protein
MTSRSALLPSLAFAALLTAGPAAASDVFFLESDFTDGTWTPLTPFTGVPLGPGESASAVTTRAVRQDAGGVLRQRLSLGHVSGFDSLWAPIAMTGFTYTPGTDGPILGLSLSVRTFQNPTANLFGAIRVFVEQDGQLYSMSAAVLEPGSSMSGFAFNEPTRTRSISGLVGSDFFRLTGGQFDLNVAPNFISGSTLRFGFGYSLTSSGMIGVGEQTANMDFDQVSIRMTTAPRCLADVAGGNEDALPSGGPDGNVDGADFIAFINSFAIGDAAVDPTADVVGGANQLLAEGGPDGTIDGSDFIAFINAFAAGC